MFEIFEREPVLRFDVPQGVSAARIVSTFSGPVADRQFIFTVRHIDVEFSDDREIGGLHWSTNLDCSFEYVERMQQNAQSLGKKFDLRSTGSRLEIACVRWNKNTGNPDVEITSLALELFLEERSFPSPFKQLLVPGRVV